MRYRCLILFLLLTTLLSHCLAATSSTKPPPNPKIVIVGAGVSGIGAAAHLLEYGFKDITLLEAEPRIGGRINTVPFGENVIDLGAQWCHGEKKDNDVYNLAFKAGILEHSTAVDTNFTYARSNAEILSKELSKRLENIMSIVRQKAIEEGGSYNGSIGSFMREKFQSLLASKENDDIDKTIAAEFYETSDKRQSVGEAADTMDMVSSSDYVNYEEIEGDNLLNWKDKGYKEFLRLLMKSAETGKELGILEGLVKLSKKVERISWQRGDYKTLVKCADGEEILADHVIVTVSLGVLKENSDSMFEPPLPAEKQKLIKALAFGSFNKIFLEFPTRFWPENMGNIVMLWRKEDLEELRNTNQSWLEGIYWFNALKYQPNVLEGWIMGENARKMEKMSLEDIETGAMYILRRFFGKTVEVPSPVSVTTSKWYTNPNFRGCYSYYSVESEKAGLSNQFLANTLRGVCDLKNYQDMCEKPVLQFAGEATIAFRYATVHGALESGFREAQKIHDYYVYGPQSVRDQYQLKDVWFKG